MFLPWVHNSHVIHRGHQHQNGLENDFCNNYVKLYKNIRIKKLGEDLLNKTRPKKVGLHIYLELHDVYKELKRFFSQPCRVSNIKRSTQVVASN